MKILFKSAMYQLTVFRIFNGKSYKGQFPYYSTSGPITGRTEPEEFDNISAIYEKMININTFGQHTKWRRAFVKCLAPLDKMKILDAAGGTGLTTMAMLNEATETKSKLNFAITLCDFSFGMMKIGQNKIEQRQDYKELVEFVETDVHNLSFKNETFDLALLTFSFRKGVDIHATFKELFRVLKPGGIVGVMDFCYSKNPTKIQRLYNLFLDHIYSKIAYILWKRPDVAYYIADSIRNSPSQVEVQKMLKSAGFSQISTQSYMGGVTYHYIGHKI